MTLDSCQYNITHVDVSCIHICYFYVRKPLKYSSICCPCLPTAPTQVRTASLLFWDKFEVNLIDSSLQYIDPMYTPGHYSCLTFKVGDEAAPYLKHY